MPAFIMNGKIYGGKVINDYSEQETLIGSFLQRKLFRKVVTVTSGLAKDNTIKVCDIPTGMHELINAYGVIKTQQGSFSNGDILVYSSQTDNGVFVKQNFTSYPEKIYVILEYTK